MKEECQGLCAADLPYRGVLLRDVGTEQTAQGQRVHNWQEQGERWCGFSQLRNSQSWHADQQMPGEVYTVKMRFDGLTARVRVGWRIVVKRKTLNIVGVNNVDEMDRVIELTCRRLQEEL